MHIAMVWISFGISSGADTEAEKSRACGEGGVEVAQRRAQLEVHTVPFSQAPASVRAKSVPYSNSASVYVV